MEPRTLETQRPMTLDEWAALPDRRCGEWVDGVLVEDELAGVAHELCMVWLARVLGNWAVVTAALVIGSDARFAVAPGRGRKPDLAVYFAGSPWPPRHGVIRVRPDVMIEIVSPDDARHARRDRVEKLDEYAVFGVRFYWILDPEIRALEIYELGHDGAYVRRTSATDDVVDVVPGFDGLRLDLPGLWAALDRLPAE